MKVDNEPGVWIPLMEYAARNGVSLSTLRRYIKAHKIRYRVEEGRYLVFDDGKGTASESEQLRLLELELQKAREEAADLRMLVAIYEEQAARPRLDS